MTYCYWICREFQNSWERRPCPVCHTKRQIDVFGSTYPPSPENARCDQIFFGCKTCYIATIGKRATAKGLPTIHHDNYIQPKWKILQSINKILHLVSHLGLKAAPLIVKTEPSDFVPGSSDTHAQLLNFSAPLCFILSDHA